MSKLAPAALCRPVTKPSIPLDERLAWSANDVTKLIPVSSRMILKLAAEGKLASIRVGRRVLFEPSAVRAYLAQHATCAK